MGEEAAMRTMIRIAALALTVISTRVDAQSVAVDEQTRKLVESKIEEWTQEVIDNPQDYKTLVAIGAAYGSPGRYPEALAFYRRAIVIRPTYADSHLGLERRPPAMPKLCPWPR